MTRDAEHTPSPQSVVTLERAEYERLIGVAEDLISNTQDPGTEALAAVYCARRILATPAPSSLAGGEVLDALDQELIDRGLRTVRAYDAVRFLRDALSATTARLTGYDWNADPEGLTQKQGDAFALADKVFADLSAAVDAHPDIELPECQTCGGTGKIEEAARTEGANQHSACVRSCEDCDGCGFAPDEEPSAILAALSPEAPARDDEAVKGPGDYTMVLTEPQAFEVFPALASHIERMAVGRSVGSLIEWDGFLQALNAALTPRHEARASEGGAVAFRDVFLSWHEECGTVERAGYGASPIGKFQNRWPGFHKKLWDAAMKSHDALRDAWVEVAKECEK